MTATTTTRLIPTITPPIKASMILSPLSNLCHALLIHCVTWKCFAIPLPCRSVQSRFQSMLFNTKPPPRIALPPLFSARPFPFDTLRGNSTALLRIAIPLLLLLCYSSHIRRPAFLTILTLRLALPQLIGSALCLNSAFFSLSLPRIAVFSFALSLRTAPFLYIAPSAYPIPHI